MLQELEHANPWLLATTLSQEELVALRAEADATFSGLGDGALPEVLDAGRVRTGLHYQLSNGSPPASVTIAQDGLLRLSWSTTPWSRLVRR
jgi:hypothetical protein